MAAVYEIIEKLCKERGITGSKMCDDLGISRSTMTELRKGRAKTMNLDKAGKVAAYFGISTDYLLGKSEEDHSLKAKDEQDIEKRLQDTLQQLENHQDGLMFSGQPLDEDTKELLILSLRNSMAIAKRSAKRFTPKKYTSEE